MDERTDMQLYCTADGTPEPTFRWGFSGAPLGDDPRITDVDGVLTIRMPTIDDEGNYQCFASNKYGTALSPVYKAIFAYQQAFHETVLIRTSIDEGDEAVLECWAPEGAPKPRVYWTDNISFKNLETNDRISYSTEGNLHFANVLESDEGGYYCFAANDLLVSTMRSPLHFLRVSSGDGQPRAATISSLPTIVSGLRTEKFIIKCLASGFPTPLISWFRNDEELPGDDSGIVLESFNQDLVFTFLGYEDAGTYECRASNTENTRPARQTVHLTVYSAPYFITAPQDLVIAPGDSSEINCDLGGVPAPSQQWLQNGAEIRDSESSVYEVSGTKIIINNVQEGDSTVFQCIAENIHGLEVGSFTITVLPIPATISVGPISRETASEGTSFQLDCLTFGSPTPTVEWHKDGVKLESGGRIIITEENDGATSHLNASDLVLNDAGIYECHALNSVDNDMQSSEISVRYREDIVTTGLPDEKNSSKEIDNVDDGVGLSPVSVVSVVAVSAGVLIAFTATVIFVRLVLCLGDERRCICTKCKKSDREEFNSTNTRGNLNTGSLDMEYEVVGKNENTPTIDSANQSPHYETSIHVTSTDFEYDYADETSPVSFNNPQASYLNIK